MMKTISILLVLLAAAALLPAPHTAMAEDSSPLNHAKQIVTSGIHSCALLDTGKVMCWGANDFGELGTGNFVWSTTPVEVINLSDVVELAVGDYHTCALTQTGSVLCWGRNNYGQLGTGSIIPDSPTPSVVVGLGSGVSGIASQAVRTCAIVRGGVVCWGQKFEYGFDNVPIPIVKEGSNVIQIALASSHNCAITSKGGVFCWGWNHTGQLGDGTEIDSYYDPVSVVGFANFRAYMPLIMYPG